MLSFHGSLVGLQTGQIQVCLTANFEKDLTFSLCLPHRHHNVQGLGVLKAREARGLSL